MLVFPETFTPSANKAHSHCVQTPSRPSQNSSINREGWQAHYLSLSAPSVGDKCKLYQKKKKKDNLENSIWSSLADQSG